MSAIIEVVPYDPSWPSFFREEALKVQKALGANCLAIHHIGSTSVPGLSAKPVIDMLPVVENILEVERSTQAMEALGYEAKGEFGIAFRRYFQKGGKVRTHNVHVFEEGNPEILRHIKFRNWLRSHPEDAKINASLKTELARKFPEDILNYCSGKEPFVNAIDCKAGYEGWRMVQALTEREWAAVRDFRQQNFFKENPDPYTWTFRHKDHVHFVFYNNGEIIGYAHLQLWPERRAAMRIIVIDEHHRGLKLGGHFLKLCERWLSHQGVQRLLIQASPDAYPFYQHLGYTAMPFNDPEGYETDPRDVEIGKVLK